MSIIFPGVVPDIYFNGVNKINDYKNEFTSLKELFSDFEIMDTALNNIKERSFWVKVNKKDKKNKNEDVEDSGIKEKDIQLATYPKGTKVKAIEISSSVYESNFKQYFGILYRRDV